MLSFRFFCKLCISNVIGDDSFSCSVIFICSIVYLLSYIALITGAICASADELGYR